MALNQEVVEYSSGADHAAADGSAGIFSSMLTVMQAATDFWTSVYTTQLSIVETAVDAATKAQDQRSWYRHPDTPAQYWMSPSSMKTLPPSFGLPGTPMAPMLWPWAEFTRSAMAAYAEVPQWTTGAAFGSLAPRNPFTASWLFWADCTRSAGLQTHLAGYDPLSMANEMMSEFTPYRGSGGHAVAQVFFEPYRKAFLQ